MEVEEAVKVVQIVCQRNALKRNTNEYRELAALESQIEELFKALEVLFNTIVEVLRPLAEFICNFLEVVKYQESRHTIPVHIVGAEKRIEYLQMKVDREYKYRKRYENRYYRA